MFNVDPYCVKNQVVTLYRLFGLTLALPLSLLPSLLPKTYVKLFRTEVTKKLFGIFLIPCHEYEILRSI